MINFLSSAFFYIAVAAIIGFLLTFSIFFITVLMKVFNKDIGFKPLIYSSSLLILMVSILLLSQSYIGYSLSNTLRYGENISVFIEGRKACKKEVFISSFKDMQRIKVRSGSHPKNETLLVFSDGNTDYRFNIKQDSRDEDLYWVYFEGFILSGAIGFVTLDSELLSSSACQE